MQDFNVIIGIPEDRDEDLFFGPIRNGVDTTLVLKPSDVSNLQSLLKLLKIIDNTKQARDLGMVGPIPFGFTDYEVGKKKRRLSILNLGLSDAN